MSTSHIVHDNNNKRNMRSQTQTNNNKLENKEINLLKHEDDSVVVFD